MRFESDAAVARAVVQADEPGRRRAPRRSPRAARLLVAVLWSFDLALASGGVDPQQTQTGVPEFPARVEMVTVDVVVTGSNGRPVAGLGRGDFTLAEDDVPQVLSTFEPVELPEQPTSARPDRIEVSTNVRAESRVPKGRWFGLVLDDLHLEQREAQYAKAAVDRFLETAVREGDLATLAPSSGDVWWTAALKSGRDELRAHRTFPAGSVLFVRYDVYGATNDPGTGRPRVLTGLEIRRGDGSVLGRGELVPSIRRPRDGSPALPTCASPPHPGPTSWCSPSGMT